MICIVREIWIFVKKKAPHQNKNKKKQKTWQFPDNIKENYGNPWPLTSEGTYRLKSIIKKNKTPNFKKYTKFFENSIFGIPFVNHFLKILFTQIKPQE